jgi:hypothetical protein
MESKKSIELRSINHMLTQSVTERDLALLRQIDETLDQLQIEVCVFGHYDKLVSKASESLKTASVRLDKDDKLLSMFEKTRDAVEHLYDHTEKQCASARADTKLCDEDGVVDGYCQLLETLANLHRSLNDLCWAIGENSADHDNVLPGEFGSADDLFAAMGV